MSPTPAPFKQSPGRWPDLFPSADGPEIEAALPGYPIWLPSSRKSARAQPAISQPDFMDILHRLEAIDLLASRLGHYPNLWFASDHPEPAGPIPAGQGRAVLGRPGQPHPVLHPVVEGPAG